MAEKDKHLELLSYEFRATADPAAGEEHELEYDLIAGQVVGDEMEREGKMTTKDFTLEAGGDVQEGPSAPSVSEIVVTKQTDGASAGEGAGLGDGSVRDQTPPPQAIELENVQITSYQLGVLDNNAAGNEHEVEYDLVAARVAGPGGETDAHGAGGGGGAGKVSVHDISLMDEDDGPSSLAALKPTGGGGEQTYLAVKLENVQITSYSVHGDAGDAGGGTEHEDSWEDAL